MTVSADRLRKVRDQILVYVYENGAGSPNFDVSGKHVQHALNLTSDEMSEAVLLMHTQGFLAQGQVGSIGLSEYGQAEAERLGPAVLMREPPAPSAIHVHANHSIVQVAGAGSTQHASLSMQNSELQAIFAEIERAIPTLGIPDADKEHAKGLLSSLRSGVGTIADAGLKAIGASLGGVLTSAGSPLGKRLAELLGISLL